MENKGVLSRDNYNTQTITVFTKLSNFFADLYYNLLYIEAIKLRDSGKTVSITDAYRHSVLAFIGAFDPKSNHHDPKNFHNLLIRLHAHFHFNRIESNMTQFIDELLGAYVPIDYFDVLSSDAKKKALHVILIDLIDEFTKVVIKEYLSSIIDNHNDQANIIAIVERMIDINIIERLNFYGKCLNTKLKKNTVDNSIVNKMKLDIEKLIVLNKKVLSENKNIKAQLDVRNEQIKKVLKKYKDLVKSHKSLQDENNAYRKQKFDHEKQVYTLRKTINDLRLMQQQQYNYNDTNDEVVEDVIDDDNNDNSIIITDVDNTSNENDIDVSQSVETMNSLIDNHTVVNMGEAPRINDDLSNFY